MAESTPNEPGSVGTGRRPRAATLAVAIGLIGILVPIVLGVRFAVGPGPVTQDPPTPETVQKVSLGTTPTEPLPVKPREVRAVTIAPQAVRTLETVYDQHDYDLNAIAGDDDAVPPIFVSTFPEDWRNIERAETRKKLFVKTVLPLILKANAAIRTDRRRLLELAAQANGDPANLDDGARYWLSQLASRYQVDGIDFAELKKRVDIIPPSLAIAQAANESGWGTSRFARQGNALFGQWTWNPSEGIKPKELQKGKGNYAVRKFPTLGESVSAYMMNLNTHRAYAPMRERRAELRKADKPLSGSTLAGGLIKYSQRGQAYIEEIRGMMSYNDFQRYDDSRLGSETLG